MVERSEDELWRNPHGRIAHYLDRDRAVCLLAPEATHLNALNTLICHPNYEIRDTRNDTTARVIQVNLSKSFTLFLRSAAKDKRGGAKVN